MNTLLSQVIPMPVYIDSSNTPIDPAGRVALGVIMLFAILGTTALFINAGCDKHPRIQKAAGWVAAICGTLFIGAMILGCIKMITG